MVNGEIRRPAAGEDPGAGRTVGNRAILRTMAYDLELADRLRDLLAVEPDLTQRRMFGGLAFMVAGHMTVCVTDTGLMVRVPPALSEELLSDPAATRMVMQGRELAGWLVVAMDAGVSDAELTRWVGHGLDYVRSLPPK